MGVTLAHMLHSFLGARDAQSGIPLLLVHLNLVVYAMAYWMQQPVLPFLTAELGADMQTLGILQSVISTCAFIGGPGLGRVVDERGAKTAMILTQGGSLVMYGLMALTTTLPILFLSRIPALVQHCNLCSQAAVSKLSSSENRAVALGRLVLSYQIGMSIGAPLGGSLTTWYGSHFAAFMAFLITLIVFICDILFLPGDMLGSERHGKRKDIERETALGTAERKEEDEKKKKKKKPGAWDKTKLILHVLAEPAVMDNAIVSMCISMARTIKRSHFSMAGKDHFGMDAQMVGAFMAFASGLSLVANVFTVSAITSRFGDSKRAVAGATMVSLCSYVLLAGCNDITMLVLIMFPLSQGNSVTYTLMSSAMSKAGSEDEVGTRIALSHALRALCGIAAPLITGFLYARVGYAGPPLCAAAATGMGMTYVLLKRDKTEKQA